MNLRPFLTLVVVALAGCVRTPAPAVSAKPDEPFVLAPGAVASLVDGATMRYASLVEDSRCPPDVQCVWAGTVRVAVEITSGAETRTDTLDLTRPPRSTRVGEWTVRFVAFDPAPARSGERIALERTRATFVLTRQPQ